MNLRPGYIRTHLLLLLSLLALSCGPQDNSDDSDVREFRAYMERNNDLFNKGEITRHETLIQKMDSFYYRSKSLSRHGVATICIAKGAMYFELREYDSCNKYVDSAMHVMEQSGLTGRYTYDYIDMLCNKGKVLYATNHFNQAYNYYFKARTLARQTKDTCAFQTFNYGLAMIAYQQKKYREAAEYFKNSFRSGSYCPSTFAYHLQEDLDNIALCYEKLAIYDTALFYYDSARSFVLNHPGTFGMEMTRDRPLGVIYGNMGGVYLSMGRMDTAIELLKKGFALNIQWRYDNTDALLTHLKLARAYLQTGDIALLKQNLQDIRAELDSIAHPLEAEGKWRELMYQFYEKTGKEEEATRFFHSYVSLRDSLWQLDKMQLQNDLNREMRDKEQSGEIELLQKQNQLNNTYLWVTIGFAVLTLVIIAQVYVNYRRGKKNIQELKELNNRVNEQKRQLERTATELRQSNLDKDRILHIVAHDLRSPLSAINMLSYMTRDEETTPQTREFLDMMLTASDNGLALINELLQYSGGSAAADAGKKEPADLNELVKSATDLLQFKAGEKQQTIALATSQDALPVTVNKGKMTRVIDNLVTNAIKFSQAGGTIYVQMSRRGTNAIVEIRDNGVGIPEKYKANLFDAFSAAKRPGTAGEKSFGLGLSICKQIVEANAGRIWFESEEGKGTSFFIELPLTQ